MEFHKIGKLYKYGIIRVFKDYGIVWQAFSRLAELYNKQFLTNKNCLAAFL